MSDFQKPIVAPPTIFGVSLIVSALFGFASPTPFLPLLLQLTAGPAIILSGVLIIRSSMREIAAANTTYDPFAQSTALVTTGIYRHSRNPGYLGLAIIQFGFSALLDNLWIAVAALLAMAVTDHWVIRLEEKKLSDKFGASYRAYCDAVRRWI